MKTATKLILLLAVLGTLTVVAVSGAQSEPFIGEIRLFAGNFAQRGWAFCHGQLLPIAQHTALFSILGTIYGGDGTTTFALPDLRGRAAIGAGSGPDLTPSPLGSHGGQEEVSLSVDQLPPHTHPAMASSDNADTSSPMGNVWATKRRTFKSADADVEMGASAIGETGEGQPVNVLDPFLALNYIIALEGLYPSRN
jgi:microcystin-dependent protein